jgi:hypothetical protein
VGAVYRAIDRVARLCLRKPSSAKAVIVKMMIVEPMIEERMVMMVPRLHRGRRWR